MIVKLIWLALLLTMACRLLTGRWPWRLFMKSQSGPAIAAAEERLRARALLVVAQGAGREEIIEAHRRLIAMVHPDRGGTSEQVHEANSARDLLLREVAVRDTEQS
jgi:DnaJ family protein C protein 19